MKNSSLLSKTILAIETSCDETAAAVLNVQWQGKNFPKITTLSSVVKSQIQLHSKMGGVVPEVAARAHVKNILPVVKKALRDARIKIPLTPPLPGHTNTSHSHSHIDYIAVTQGPGLIPSLIIGVEFAKALSLAAHIPLIPINHMAGHLYSPFAQNESGPLQQKAALFPMVSLVVSGGHTTLVLMKDLHQHQVLGNTVDDAAGEAFDKVAKLLQLPYPGGPEVSALAKLGKPAFTFPRPMVHTKDYNFSFAGLKTAVLYHLRDHPETSKQDICKAFEDAVVEVLITKTLKAAKQYRAKAISLSGGVSANRQLRATLAEQCKHAGLACFIPPANLSTDNAEMIGMAAAIALSTNTYKTKPPSKISANPNLQL